MELTKAAADVLAERQRQVTTEGRNCDRLLPAERSCCGTFHGSPHRATCAKYRGKFKVQNVELTGNGATTVENK